MRVFNVIGAFLVLVCNLVVSFSHTLELFRSGGFTGGLEYIAAFGVETTFIMGALNIVYSRLKDISPGFPSMMGGLLGVALVSWSNVSAGWSYGVTGILLGLATPASLVVAEAILSRAILQRSTVKARSSKQVNPNKTEHSKVEVTKEKAMATVKNIANKLGSTKAESQFSSKAESPEPKEKAENSSSAKPEIAASKVENEVEKKVETSTKTPAEWALLLYQRDGELPGRKRLMEIAGCTEWEARKVLAELRKTAGILAN